MQSHLNMQQWRNSQPESRPRHQVCYDALMGFALVDLSKLFLSIELYANSIF